MQHSAQGVSSLQEFKSLIDSRQGHVVGYELIDAELLHTQSNVNNLQNQKVESILQNLQSSDRALSF